MPTTRASGRVTANLTALGQPCDIQLCVVGRVSISALSLAVWRRGCCIEQSNTEQTGGTYDMVNAGTLAGELGTDQNSIVAACPACAFARSHRSKRQFWERISGLRAFRCTVCSHRFSKMDRDAEPWRTLNRKMAGARTWISQIGPAVTALRSRRRPA